MRFIICEEPGRMVLGLRAKPPIIEGYAQIRIKRIGICGTDLHAFEGTQPFFNYPRVLGHELSGDLVEPNGAPGFTKGEIVTCIPYFHCGVCIACRSGKPNCCASIRVSGVHIDGGMTEYLNVPIYSLVHNNGLAYDELALVEPLAIGAHGIRRAAVQPGEYVLVIGAGPIGLGIMEFARIAGAQVIALDLNPRRLEFCRNRLKVDYIIDGSSEDVLERLTSITKGDMPSVVMDATGNLKAINQGFRYMAYGGRYVLVGLQKGDINFNHPEFHKREASLMSSRNATRQDFEQVIESMRNGWVQPTNYITHRVPFGQAIEKFETWLDPDNGVIKAMIEV